MNSTEWSDYVIRQREWLEATQSQAERHRRQQSEADRAYQQEMLRASIELRMAVLQSQAEFWRQLPIKIRQSQGPAAIQLAGPKHTAAASLQVGRLSLRNWQVAAVALILLLIGMLMAPASAQEPDHPAFGTQHTSTLIVTSEVTDIPKLETKAIDVLRQVGTVTGETMTLEEARAKVRIDASGNPDPKGRTDVARCLEIVISNWLKGIAQANVVGSTVANQHPEPIDQ